MAKKKTSVDNTIEPAQAAHQQQIDPNTKYLLSSISYTNRADYENFLDNLSPEHAVIVLIAAANHSHQKGIYSLDEAELIAKSIRTLTPAAPQPEAEQPLTEGTKK